MKIKREVEVDIDLTVGEVASAFWKMSAEEQVDFFNFLSLIASKPDFTMQMEYVRTNEFLNKNGSWIMNTIGEYSNQ